MIYFNTHSTNLKSTIFNFSKKICSSSSKPFLKFTFDMLFGIAKSKSVLLSSISHALQENIQKINTINRLSDNLNKPFPTCVDSHYLELVLNVLGKKPVFLVDDTDIIKPLGTKFEALGQVRDGSSPHKTFEKGYYLTEIVGITKKEKQPISVFSKIHSSIDPVYDSQNQVTFEGLNYVIDALKQRKIKGIFVFDRGYDNNKIFEFIFEKKQNFIIRLTEKRNIKVNEKWKKIKEVSQLFKGKTKISFTFQGKKSDCYISVLNSQLSAKDENVNILFVYGLCDTPMMLATNLKITSKEDISKIVRLYFSRWRIEEYFKFKKQEYDFENYRVRKLLAMNHLNKMLTYVIGLIAMLCEEKKTNLLVNEIIKESKSLRKKVCLWLYQVARGIYNILIFFRSSIREKPKVGLFYEQLSLF